MVTALVMIVMGCSRIQHAQTTSAKLEPDITAITNRSNRPMILAWTNIVTDDPRYSNDLSLAEIHHEKRLAPVAAVGDPEQPITMRMVRELLDRNGIKHTTFSGLGLFVMVRANDFSRAITLLQNDISLKGRALQIAKERP